MQSTGHTSTHALSFTLMHGSAIMYGIEASQFSESAAACSDWLNPWICTRIAAACQALGGARRGAAPERRGGPYARAGPPAIACAGVGPARRAASRRRG